MKSAKNAVKGCHFPVFHFLNKVRPINDRCLGLHTRERSLLGGRVVIRACKGDQFIMLCIMLSHRVFKLRPTGVADLHTMHVTGKQSDVIDITSPTAVLIHISTAALR